MKLNVLVFGPHPDDAEIGCGGLLLKMKDLGYATGIVDMTRGDMGWGTPEQRDQECVAAAKILKLDVRVNLDLGDNRIEDTFENRCAVAATIRKYRPELLFAPYYDLPIGRGLGHNDHWKTGILVSQAFNLAHLAKAPVEGEPFQAKAVYYYFVPPGMRPTFTVDVSKYFKEWMEALAEHKTQFYNPEKPKPTTPLPEIGDYIGTLSQANGWAIGAKHAQSFLSTSPLRITDPMEFVKELHARP